MRANKQTVGPGVTVPNDPVIATFAILGERVAGRSSTARAVTDLGAGVVSAREVSGAQP